MADPEAPPLAAPLSPEEMWRQAVQSQRGFQSSPSSAADAIRQRPATIPPGAAAGDKGPKVGKGFETFAGVQVLDKDGRRAAFGADFFGGGGLDEHAEARIVRGLEKNGPAAVQHGRMIVVVETDCCPSCEARLTAYAQRKGLREIEIHVPERESLREAGKMVTPKTASTTSLMDTGKPTTVRKLRSISVPPPVALAKLDAFRITLLNQVNFYSSEHQAERQLATDSFVGYVTNRLFNPDIPEMMIWNNAYARLTAVERELRHENVKGAFKELVLARLQYLRALRQYLTWKDGIEGAGTAMITAICAVAAVLILGAFALAADAIGTALTGLLATEQATATAAASARVAASLAQFDAAIASTAAGGETVGLRIAQIEVETAVDEYVEIIMSR